jgi:6-phosphogluconolactonase (cycloisomerase 2 family)
MSTVGLPGLWVGTYTSDSKGNGRGIHAIAVDDGRLETARLAASTASPSFLAAHPSRPVLYAVGERAQTLTAFSSAASGELQQLGDAWPAGESACHVTVDADGRFAVVACYGDGRVLTYELDESGAIAARFEGTQATDPYAGDDVVLAEPFNGAAAAADRTSRAHASLQLPDGRIVTTDLGFDLVRTWHFEPGVGLVLEHETTLPAGSGPRHLARHPSGHIYVVTEYSIEVVVLAPDAAARYQVVGATPATVGGAKTGDAAAHITVSDTGDHVHATIRGSNRVAVLAVRDDGARLEPTADVDCGGAWPRHHLEAGSVLLVANQLSDSIAVFRLDDRGVPSELLQSLETGSPTCLIRQS